jgi:predicted RNA binding protein YcfA (HicA-like mRNA interferase family)
MRQAEFKKKLKQNGFYLLRRGKHPIYSDGLSRIVMPSGGNTIERRLSKSLEIDLKKAMKRREGATKERGEEAMQAFNAPKIVTQEKVSPSVPEPVTQKFETKAISASELYRIIKPMRDQGMKIHEIVTRLIVDGHRRPKSGKPYDPPSISKILKNGLETAGGGDSANKEDNAAHPEIATISGLRRYCQFSSSENRGCRSIQSWNRNEERIDS